MGIKLDNVPLMFLVISLVVAFAGRMFFDYSLSDALFYGALIGFLPLGILALLCIVIVLFFGGFDNDRPPCECGNCSSNDYHYINHDSDGFHYVCPACQLECVVQNKIFYRKNPDGTFSAMQRLTKWGKWTSIKD
ncbi:MAG: hypothetical protein P1V19_19940 [Gimesia sp.]|nr:hypothetical protein [Gimesia sp.]